MMAFHELVRGPSPWSRLRLVALACCFALLASGKASSLDKAAKVEDVQPLVHERRPHWLPPRENSVQSAFAVPAAVNDVPVFRKDSRPSPVKSDSGGKRKKKRSAVRRVRLLLLGIALTTAVLLGAFALKRGAGGATSFAASISGIDTKWKSIAEDFSMELFASRLHTEKLRRQASKLRAELHHVQSREHDQALRSEWISVQEAAYGFQLRDLVYTFLKSKNFSEEAVNHVKKEMKELQHSFSHGISFYREAHEIKHADGEFRPPAESPTLRQRQWQTDIKRAVSICHMTGVTSVAPLAENHRDRIYFRSMKEELAQAAKAARKQKNEAEKMSDLHEAALKLLSGASPCDLPGTFTVQRFRTIGRKPRSYGDARFQLGRLLLTDRTGMVFEVVLLDSDIQKAIGTNTLAVKLPICRASSGNAWERLKSAAAAELKVAERVVMHARTMSQARLSATEVMLRSGLHFPVFRGILKQGPMNSSLEGVVYSSHLTFSHSFLSDAGSSLRVLKAQNAELSRGARLYMAQRVLRIAAGLNLAGLCHNAHDLGSIRILEDGTPVVGYFAAASTPGTSTPAFAVQDLPLPADLTGESVLSTTSAFEGDSWTAGRVAYMILVGEEPYAEHEEIMMIEPTGNLQLQSSAFNDNNMVKVQGQCLPTFRMRQHHIPEQWIQLLASLLMQDSKYRPNLLQALAAFPSLFAEGWRPGTAQHAAQQL